MLRTVADRSTRNVEDLAIELVQNARLSGAWTLWVEASDEETTVRDDGIGIEDWGVLWQAGKSGWPPEVRSAEGALGVGLFSLSRWLPVEIVSKRPGESAWRLRIDDEEQILGETDIEVERVPQGLQERMEEQGTEVRFATPNGDPERMLAALHAAAEAAGVGVAGMKGRRQRRPKGEVYGGNVCDVEVRCTEERSGGGTVNVHGRSAGWIADLVAEEALPEGKGGGYRRWTPHARVRDEVLMRRPGAKEGVGDQGRKTRLRVDAARALLDHLAQMELRPVLTTASRNRVEAVAQCPYERGDARLLEVAVVGATGLEAAVRVWNDTQERHWVVEHDALTAEAEAMLMQADALAERALHWFAEVPALEGTDWYDQLPKVKRVGWTPGPGGTVLLEWVDHREERHHWPIAVGCAPSEGPVFADEVPEVAQAVDRSMAQTLGVDTLRGIFSQAYALDHKEEGMSARVRQSDAWQAEAERWCNGPDGGSGGGPGTDKPDAARTESWQAVLGNELERMASRLERSRGVRREVEEMLKETDSLDADVVGTVETLGTTELFSIVPKEEALRRVAEKLAVDRDGGPEEMKKLFHVYVRYARWYYTRAEVMAGSRAEAIRLGLAHADGDEAVWDGGEECGENELVVEDQEERPEQAEPTGTEAGEGGEDTAQAETESGPKEEWYVWIGYPRWYYTRAGVWAKDQAEANEKALAHADSDEAVWDDGDDVGDNVVVEVQRQDAEAVQVAQAVEATPEGEAVDWSVWLRYPVWHDAEFNVRARNAEEAKRVALAQSAGEDVGWTESDEDGPREVVEVKQT